MEFVYGLHFIVIDSNTKNVFDGEKIAYATLIELISNLSCYQFQPLITICKDIH